MAVKNFLKSISLPLIVLFMWLIFEEKLMYMFDTKILPILSNLNFNTTTNFLFFLLTILSLYIIYRCFKNRYFIQHQIFFVSCILIFIYAKYRLYGGYVSTPSIICNFGYTDIGIIILILFLLSCLFSYFNFPNSKKNSKCNVFISDKPILKPESDILDYSESAKRLAKNLEKTEMNSSFSIGLIAPWGTGKTSYLNLLEYYLDKDKFIVVKFNPRNSKNTTCIQQDFFNELFSKLSSYDLRFSSTFKDYLKSINVIEENKVISFIFNVSKIWNRENEKDNINNVILRLNKRIIVIVEDFDRLLSDEIIEVFKLIDGNASFSNIIFITAYDKKHVNDIIGKTYSNEEAFFSDKFFNIEQQIPLRPYDKIFAYFESQLLDRIKADIEEVDFYKSTLSNHIELLKKYIVTLRDAKRFLNLFAYQYVRVKDEVEFRDYFLLYLIKYKYLDEYLKLYKKEIISNDISSNQMSLSNHSEMKSKDILEILFPETASCKLRSINNNMAFDIYFYENVYGHLKLTEMECVFEQDKDYKELIRQFVSQQYAQDFVSFIDSKNILTLQSKKQFERYIDICLYMYVQNIDKSIFYFKILSLINTEQSKEIQYIYKYTYDEYKNVISVKLKGTYPEYPYNIVRSIIIGIINNEFPEKIIFDKKDILNIAMESLHDLLYHQEYVNQQHIELLYSCISDINQRTRIVILDKNSCSIIRQHIIEKPAGYFKNFIRLGMISFNKEFNSVACEPFWKQIFNDKADFESFIKEQNKSTVPNIDLIRNFWDLYKNNNYKPIEFQNQGNVQEKINNGLVKEIKELNKLLDIEKELQTYIEDRKELKHDNPFYINKYNDLLSRLDKNKLHITKRIEIRNKIQAELSDIQ